MILFGRSYFNAMSNDKPMIKCILYGLGGIEISNAMRTLIITCRVYWIAGFSFIVFSGLGIHPTNSGIR